MPTLRESRTPNVPNKSPFRIRDSQMAKMQHLENNRWSFSMELVNMWSIKPPVIVEISYHHDNNNKNYTGNLLTQLLVSQAILDSNEYKILPFEKLDKLKKEYFDLHEHIKNVSKSIELENRIKNISKSLENINLKNSRNSIIYLQNQRQNNDYKINYLSIQLQDLKQKEIDMKKTILQHTAAVLNKGIQYIETTPPTPSFTPVNNNNSQIVFIESELNEISTRIDHLFSRYFINCDKQSCTLIDKLHLLDQQLFGSGGKKKKKQSRIIIKLLAIEHERNFLLSKLIEMELKSTKLLENITFYSNRQLALKFEILQFKGEALELKIIEKNRQLDDESGIPTNNNHAVMISNYEKQLSTKAQFYEANIKQQNTCLEKTSLTKEELEANVKKIKSVKIGLDDLIKEKSRILDVQDVQISRLQDEMRMQTNTSPIQQPYIPEPKEEKERRRKIFQEKEGKWTKHTHYMEDQFDQLLEGFDSLTNSAIEFDSSRMKFDRKIEELNQTIHLLESELIDEKVKKIGYNNTGEAPTTASLRKEFRSLVAEMKKTHEQRMEQEAQESRRLHEQLEELQNNKYTTGNRTGHSIAIQTD